MKSSYCLSLLYLHSPLAVSFFMDLRVTSATFILCIGLADHSHPPASWDRQVFICCFQPISPTLQQKFFWLLLIRIPFIYTLTNSSHFIQRLSSSPYVIWSTFVLIMPPASALPVHVIGIFIFLLQRPFMGILNKSSFKPSLANLLPDCYFQNGCFDTSLQNFLPFFT